ncbi:Protein of unknown function [Gracilibacillus ureilyticus]|uniref:DUF2975 domain-containing protein n=1 Tax=Gracilibacillus ureilyticus TaxID=531814 RepID=A0A1H9R702_9BACI|nr:DUF2975 domain-containing protein [Gracilibacillus ureilyticus]SER68305.1 Protein of unknown function [Gracilibacillus ureilyticus]
MKLKALFKFAYIFCSIGFYLALIISFFSFAYHIAYLWFPESNFAKSVGPFEPMYSYLIIYFEEIPAIYLDKNVIMLSFIATITLFLYILVVLRILHKLFKNIYRQSLFIEQNVKLLYMLGAIDLVLGSVFIYFDGLIFEKVLTALEITNATVEFTNIDYIETIISGVIFIMIGAALKVAVRAIEENKYTI